MPGLWSLDDLSDPDTAAVLEEAAASPERFVLKPQREGGGNNLYGEELKARLAERRGLAAYILMQRIQPPINRCSFKESVSEKSCLKRGPRVHPARNPV